MRRSTRILGHSAGTYVSVSASKARPSPDHAATYPKGQRMVEIVQDRRPGLAPLPVPEAVHGPSPSWGSRVFGTALTSCRRLILNLQTRHELSTLGDYQLRDIGLWRDRIRPPSMTVLQERRW